MCASRLAVIAPDNVSEGCPECYQYEKERPVNLQVVQGLHNPHFSPNIRVNKRVEVTDLEAVDVSP